MSRPLRVDGTRSTGGGADRADGLVDRLDPDDNFGVVAFDDTVRLVVPAGPLTDKPAVKQASPRSRPAAGPTCPPGTSGGCRRRSASSDRPGRHVSSSRTEWPIRAYGPDPAAGCGCTAACGRVRTSTLGVGLGFDETLLNALARGGEGNELFAEDADTAGALIAGEVDGLLDQVAQAASLRITWGPYVTGVEVLNELTVTGLPDGNQVELGSFYAGETRRLVLTMKVPGIAALGLVQVATLEFTHVALPDLVMHTTSVPVHVNVVPGDQAAGRIPDPKVRSEALFQRTQRDKREAGRLLSQGRTDEARSFLGSKGAQLRTDAGQLPPGMSFDLLAEADFLDALVEEAGVDHSRAAKVMSTDTTSKSRLRGRQVRGGRLRMRSLDGAAELVLEAWEVQRLVRGLPDALVRVLRPSTNPRAAAAAQSVARRPRRGPRGVRLLHGCLPGRRLHRRARVTPPLLLLDVDGVLNALGDDGQLKAAGGDWRQGWATADGTRWPITWSPAVVARLAAWHDESRLELQWLTTWGHDANDELRALLGLPQLAVAGTYQDEDADGAATGTADSHAAAAPSAPDPLSGRWWKYDVVRRVLAAQPDREVLWVDDELQPGTAFRAGPTSSPGCTPSGPTRTSASRTATSRRCSWSWSRRPGERLDAGRARRRVRRAPARLAARSWAPDEPGAGEAGGRAAAGARRSARRRADHVAADRRARGRAHRGLHPPHAGRRQRRVGGGAAGPGRCGGAHVRRHGAARARRRRRAGAVGFSPQGAKHHAMADRGSGFCVFNDMAWAAKHFAGQGKRVLYVDLDAHHGDGVEALTRDEPLVMTCSVHDSTIFPFTRHQDERDRGVHNFPLARDAGDEELLASVAAVVELAEQWRPEVLLVAIGADGHVTDPLSTLQYSYEGYTAAARALRRHGRSACSRRPDGRRRRLPAADAHAGCLGDLRRGAVGIGGPGRAPRPAQNMSPPRSRHRR